MDFIARLNDPVTVGFVVFAAICIFIIIAALGPHAGD